MSKSRPFIVGGPSRDHMTILLHGGIVHNPNQVLIQALAGLFDDKGGIAVPGFYDGVQPLSTRERGLYDSLAANPEHYCQELGVNELKSEEGYSLLEQRWTRPTLEINHLSGGSPRTVIPATARAALSCRLVPGQDP